jgi:hypothetical protein
VEARSGQTLPEQKPSPQRNRASVASPDSMGANPGEGSGQVPIARQNQHPITMGKVSQISAGGAQAAPAPRHEDRRLSSSGQRPLPPPQDPSNMCHKKGRTGENNPATNEITMHFEFSNYSF